MIRSFFPNGIILFSFRIVFKVIKNSKKKYILQSRLVFKNNFKWLVMVFLIIKNISSAFKKKVKFYVQIKLNKNSFGQKMFQKSKNVFLGKIVRFFFKFSSFSF